MENNFPIKKITIPKVGDNKPTFKPPANIWGAISPCIADNDSNAPTRLMTKPNTPKTKEKRLRELIK